MTTLRFKPALLALVLALLASTGIASAEGAGSESTSHLYCPRGAKLYSFLFGYWCEDGTISGVQPIDCKSGPGQLPESWNNSSLPPDQVCSGKSTSTIQAMPSN